MGVDARGVDVRDHLRAAGQEVELAWRRGGVGKPVAVPEPGVVVRPGQVPTERVGGVAPASVFGPMLSERCPALGEGGPVPVAQQRPGVERVVGVLGRVVEGETGLPEPAGKVVQGATPGVGQLRLDRRAEPLQRGALGLGTLGRIDGNQGGAATGQDAVEGVKVALADGVELVVVAAGAGDRQAEEAFGEDVDLVVGEGRLFVEGVGRGEAVRHHPVMGGAEGRFVDVQLPVDSRDREQVPRDVLANEPIVRHVVVERPDQVVAIAPGERDGRVALAAVRFGEPEPVHPVPRPALAEAGRLQEAVHQVLVGAGRPVPLEPFDLLGRGGKARQRERDAADQGAAVGGPGRFQPIAFQIGEDEAVHAMIGPARAARLRQRRLPDRLKAPPLFPVVADRLPGGQRAQLLGRGRRVPRVGRAQADPAGEVGDDRVRELRVSLGHPGTSLPVPDRLDEEALLGLAGDEGRAGIAPRAQARPVVERQSPLGLVPTVVALVTALDKHGANPRLEELGPGLAGQGGGRRDGQEEDRERRGLATIGKIS